MIIDDRSITGGSFYTLSLLDNTSPNVSKQWIFYTFMITVIARNFMINSYSSQFSRRNLVQILCDNFWQGGEGQIITLDHGGEGWSIGGQNMIAGYLNSP